MAKSAASELTNHMVARIIHLELVVSTSGVVSSSGLRICNDFHLKEADILPLNLIKFATMNSINKRSSPLNPQGLN